MPNSFQAREEPLPATLGFVLAIGTRLQDEPADQLVRFTFADVDTGALALAIVAYGGRRTTTSRKHTTSRRVCGRGKGRTTMELIERFDTATVARREPIAESDQFAIYAEGDDTYVLVQRHAATPWTAVRFSGDGVFRVGALLVDAMRHLYRDVASDLSPSNAGR